jgi:hypothetical protein
MSKEVKITKDGEEGYCMESAVAAWERDGWTRADDGSSEEPEAESEPEAEEAPAKKTTRKAP